MEDAISLTFPQLKMLENNLGKILKAENGSTEKEHKTKAMNIQTNDLNTMAFENTVKYLKDKTGKTEFSFEEIYSPDKTIEKYSKVK